MKTTIAFLTAILLHAGIAAQEIDPKIDKQLDDYVLKSLFSEKKVMNSAVMNKVFTGNFYYVKSGFKQKEGSTLCGDFYLNISGDKITDFEMLDSDKELTVLFSLIRKDFLLKDEAAAKTFEATVNELFPVSDKDKPLVKHMKKNNQWIFLRDKFFDNQTAVIATVDASGTITKLEVILGYSVK